MEGGMDISEDNDTDSQSENEPWVLEETVDLIA